MPNTQNVEERIVEMRIDNKRFESGAKQTISTLEKLEKALAFLKQIAERYQVLYFTCHESRVPR